MKAIDFIKSIYYIPTSTEGQKVERPSNSELKRWFEKGNIYINDIKSNASDEVEFPINSLIFFKDNKKQTTLWVK